MVNISYSQLTMCCFCSCYYPTETIYTNFRYRRRIDVGRVAQWCRFGWRKAQRTVRRGGGLDERRQSTRRGGTRAIWSAWATWTDGAAAELWAAGCGPPPRAPAGPSFALNHASPFASSSSNTAPTSCLRTAHPHTQHNTPASPPFYALVKQSFLI